MRSEDIVRRGEHGPFDVIGDVHGCHAELVELLGELGYAVAADGLSATPPPGRRAVFLGDYCDRGPDTPAVLRLAMSMAAAGTAICLPGNHDVKLARKLRGRNVKIAHGLAQSVAQLEGEPEEFRLGVAEFIEGLVSHVVLDDRQLVVAHAGMREDFQGRPSAAARAFAIYGETTGETDEFGLPVRGDWAADYRGSAAVVYGHTPVERPRWVNGTIDIDTGCVFGGRLTALRWPERDLVSVPARRTYYEPTGARPSQTRPS
ncbi:MAG TPA: metallophosphoesterase [Solirubrobacterales bacterium]